MAQLLTGYSQCFCVIFLNFIFPSLKHHRAKNVHAATVYYPNRKAPRIDKSASNVLSYVSDDNWILQSSNKTIAEYKTDDLRISLVYRARCFKTHDELRRFQNRKPEDARPLEDILNVFLNDLKKRNRISLESTLEDITRLDLSLLILNEYIKYPLPAFESSWIPYNYCAVSKFFPFLKDPMTALSLCD